MITKLSAACKPARGESRGFVKMRRTIRNQPGVRRPRPVYQIWFYLLTRNFIKPALNSAAFSS